MLISSKQPADDPATQIRRALEMGPLTSSPFTSEPPGDRPERARDSVGPLRDPGQGWSATQIAGALAGIRYPAQRWEIVAWAQYNGASPRMVEALLSTPEGVYSGPHRIAEAVHSSTGAGCGCRHRRHPRHCSHHQSRRPEAG